MTDHSKSPFARMSRRVLLRGAALVAAACGPGGAGAVPAKTRGSSNPKRPAFDPYGQRVASGPSSARVPAIGATPSVPGTPYVVPVAAGWSVISLLTAGNTAQSGYRMSGQADGLGAFANGDGTITLLMNHEIDAGNSIVRGHGGRGSFVSRWRIDIASLEVLEGRDMVTSPDSLHLSTGRGWTTARRLLSVPTPRPGAPLKTPVASRADVDIDRLCSADAAAVSAFWDAKSGLGYKGHILLNGEESERRQSRAFAWVDATGSAYELPAFRTGKLGSDADAAPEWENLLANPKPGPSTVVAANSDGGPSQVYVYVGRKQRQGMPIAKAGLTNGRLYCLRVADVDEESRDTNVGLAKSLLGKGAGAAVTLAPPGKGTSFLRPEDGAWDPRNPDVYLFATTDRNDYAAPNSVIDGADAGQVGRSRLWAVTFDDVQNLDTTGRPTARIELLLDGTEGGDMFDNITVDRNGVVYLCEDTGEARHNGKIWAYDTASGSFTAIAKFDPALFGDVAQKVYTPPTTPFVDDKETSGILDVTALFEKAPWFKAGSTVLLATVQPHFGYDGGPAIGAQIYEGGQLVMLVKAPEAS
jgi:Bacterial protein of unknown function (DUF839)